MLSGDYELRALRAEDEPALLDAWRASFGAERARAPEEWRHLFLRNPAGTRAFVALRGGAVVAQYAGLPVRARVEGEARVFTQSVDSFVRPEHRRGLKAPGLFVRLARAYFDEYGVNGPDAVHFGWPVEAAWRIGRRFLEYELVREELALVRELAPGPHEPPDGVELLEGVDERATRLDARCAEDAGAATVRDAAWLAWRYLEHPARDYELLALRAGDEELRGLAVLRGRHPDWPGCALLVDWLVPADDEDAGEALERAVLARARAAGARRVVAWLPDWAAAFARLQRRGWRVHPTDYDLAARCFERRLDQWWLRRRWWTTLGDSDLV